jgi:penicillin-binding protein 1A
MASRRSLIGRFRGGNGRSPSRSERRARTRDARVALADDPAQLAETSRNGGDRASRNGGDQPPRLPVPDPEGKGRGRLKKLRFAFVLLGLSLLAFVAWIFGIMMAVSQDLPKLENRSQYLAAKNSVVKDINGETIATLTNNEGRILVGSTEIAPTMKEAVVAIEDQRFYDHRGVDYMGIMRAIRDDILAGGAVQGASTVTQQFVKNALEAQDSRTIFQKLREAALAYHLERQWSKDKILTEYLNSIYFGEGAYGIEAAAKTYFGFNHPNCGEEGEPGCASELLPWEAALLAGMIASPSAYSPRASPEDALVRRDQVLGNMLDQGFITQEDHDSYVAQDIPTESEIETPEENSKAPYFTSWLRQQLVDKYGAGQAFGGGLTVTSTLDLELQEQVEEIASSRLAGIEPTASVVVLENEVGAVRAMVGGNDFEKEPFNLATQGHRQPGSAFKPFTLVTALSQGRSPDEVFQSAPQTIPFQVKTEDKKGKPEIVSELFKPENYEDSYLGSASITSGTTYSDNSVYAQLGTQVGVENVAATADKLGIQTDLSTASKYKIADRDFEPYNPALVLGGLENGVTPLEMAHAYETLAEGGNRVSGTLAASPDGPVAIANVKDSDGESVETNDGEEGINRVRAEQVIEPDVATTATSILETVVSSGTGTAAASEEETWGKTGTTDDNGDAWFCGATPDITACVWVGHADSNKPMTTEFGGQPVDGGTYPALIFHDIVLAWEELQAARKAAKGGEEEVDPGYVPPVEESVPLEPVPTEPTETTPAPEEPVEPVEPENQAPVPDQGEAEDGGAGPGKREGDE